MLFSVVRHLTKHTTCTRSLMTSLKTWSPPSASAPFSTTLKVRLGQTRARFVRTQICYCSRAPRFYFSQATARAPFPLKRESCWASWRRTREMGGWGSREAAVKRALYLRPMSAVIVKAACRAFFIRLNQRGETKASDHSAGDSRRLTRTISHHKALYERAQLIYAIVAWCYVFYVPYISIHLTFPLPLPIFITWWSFSFLFLER